MSAQRGCDIPHNIAAVGLALEQLEAVHLAFDLAVAVREPRRRLERRQLGLQPAGEAGELRDAAALGLGQPRPQRSGVALAQGPAEPLDQRVGRLDVRARGPQRRQLRALALLENLGPPDEQPRRAARRQGARPGGGRAPAAFPGPLGRGRGGAPAAQAVAEVRDGAGVAPGPQLLPQEPRVAATGPPALLEVREVRVELARAARGRGALGRRLRADPPPDRLAIEIEAGGDRRDAQPRGVQPLRLLPAPLPAVAPGPLVVPRLARGRGPQGRGGLGVRCFGRVRGAGRRAQAGVLAGAGPLDRGGEVLDHVEAVEHLRRPRRAAAGALGERIPPVAGDDLDLGVVPQPHKTLPLSA